MGAPDADPPCGVQVDTDCVPPLGSVGPSDGTGPNLVINANLIMGNQAESGSGGGLALQQINGSDVVSFPTTPSNWNNVTVTNNIITNNVAGWDGAGISLLDALNVNIINNTIMSNDSTASAGILFNTIGAPLASTGGSNCIQPGSTTTSCPQPAGLVSIQNSAVLVANLPAAISCPAGHGPGGTGSGGLTNGACRHVSYPELYNDVFWQNRSYYIGVGALGTGTTNQQNVVTLYNAFTATAAPSQTATGSCPAANYWDIGVRGDTGPTNHASTFTLTPEASILTNITGYPGGGTGFRTNLASNPAVVSQYCNGSRVPPEFGGLGWQVPPGIADATVPNPIFNLTPTATVDEGNNWVNISWGPLAETNPVTGTLLGNYALTAASPAINFITPTNSATTYTAAPTTDFFNNLRKTNNAVDAGAVEFAVTVAAPTLTSIAPNTGQRGMTVSVTLTGTNLTGTTAVNVSGAGITVSAITVVNATTVTANFTISATAAQTARTVSVTTPGGTSNTVTFTVNGGTLAFTSATNGTLTTVLGVRTLTFTIPTPRVAVTSVVTLTNTSTTVPLQITAETLPINVGGLYSITGTTCSLTTPLAALGTCTVNLRYATPTVQPVLPDIGSFAAANNGTTAGVLALVAQ